MSIKDKNTQEERWGLCYQMGEAEHGVALGGLGTGSLELSTDGSFVCSSLHNNWIGEIEKLPTGSFFAISAATKESKTCKVLQAQSDYPMAAGIADLNYRGHFPFVDIDYHDDELPVQLSLEAFCPFIAFDAKNSGIPAIMFSFTLRNPGDEVVKAALAFSWANDIGIMSQTRFMGNFNTRKDSEKLSGLVMRTELERAASPRGAQCRDDQYALIVIKDSDIKFSSIPSWDAAGDGTDFFQPFSEGGEFPEEASPRCNQSDKSTDIAPTGVVSGKVELHPGEEKQIRFILSWYMPNHYDAGGVFRGHMYANWFSSAFQVAEYVASNFDYLRQYSLQWQSLIYKSSLPKWLKEAVVNYTYVLPRCSWWTKDGTFSVYEAINCPHMEMTLLRAYDVFPIMMLFPDLELKVTELIARYQLESGEMPTGVGHNSLDQPRYDSFRPQNSPTYAIMVYLDYLWSGGREYLEKMYPAAKRAIQFSMTLDTDGDYLVNNNGIDQGWDTWPMYGTAVYVCGFWLAAIKAGEKMAVLMADEEFAQECREWWEKGVKNLEQQLWTGDYYALYRDIKQDKYSSTCFLGQLHGQLFAYLLSLGEMFPSERIAKALHSINRLNVADTLYGATSGIKSDGTWDLSSTQNAQSRALVPTEIFPYASVCAFAGYPDMGLHAAEKICSFLEHKKKDPWHSLLLMYPDTGELFYGTHYIDNLNVWSLLPAMAGLNIDISQGMLSIKPSIDPITVPIFSPLFYGMATYVSETENGKIIGITLQLDNYRQTPAKIRKLITKCQCEKVSEIQIQYPDGTKRKLSQFEKKPDGTLFIEDHLTLPPGETKVFVKGKKK